MILPTIMFALAVGFGSGAAVWLAIRRVMYLEQPEELWPAIQHFWSVAHASQGRVWALIPIVIAIAVALIVVTVVSDAMDQGRRNRRGSTLIGAKFLARLTRQPRRRGVQIALASVPVPSDAESTHFLMVGSTGTGKSNAQSEMLAGAMARGDRTIVVDPNGETLARYMRDGDRILNPFDARGEGWSIFNEIQGPSDYELIAKSVIPGSAGEDETWRAKARTFLADLLQELMARGDDLTASRLLWWAAEAPRDELQLLLAGTSTAALLQPDAGRLLDSVRGILAGYLRAHGRHPSGEFSIKHWLDEESGNRLPIAGSKIYQQFVDKARKDNSVDVSQQRLEANQAVDFSQSAARWSRALMDSAHKHVAANQLAQYNQVFRDSLVRTEQAIAKDPWIAIDAWNHCGSAYGLFR